MNSNELLLKNRYSTEVISIKENVSLTAYSTMRLGGKAAYLVHVSNEEELVEAYNWAIAQKLPYKVIGSGSNLIWSDSGFKGLVIVMRLLGVTINNTTVLAKAGESWDSLVQKTVAAQLSGLEFLSLIPGTVGAVPVQNVGAYGAEVSQVITNVHAYDTEQQCMVVLTNNECNFAYRTSRFNTTDAGRFLITAVEFSLSTHLPKPPFYAALQQYLEENAIIDYSPTTIRAAVVAIRASKLPNPAIVPNTGSFFKNPIITPEEFTKLQQEFPTIVGWPHDGSIKVPAAWLLDSVGVKGLYDPATGMAVHDKQALVLINKHAESTADLLKFRNQLITKVQETFGITLQQEPELVQ